MLLGTYEHTIDAKGRLSLPSRLQKDLGERFVVTRSPDGCLFAYPPAEWEALSTRIAALAPEQAAIAQRWLFGGAMEAEPDKQGRILLLANLRAYAALEKDVVVVGVSNRVEFWNPERWQGCNSGFTPDAISHTMKNLLF